MPDSISEKRREGKGADAERGRDGGWLFGYGDAALLILLFAYLAECFGVRAGTNREIDLYVFLKGGPPLLASLVLAVKGWRSPASLGVFILAGAYILFVLLMVLVRLLH